ncbi:MAG: tRNA (guanosine(46)-N7)-methyltransferase TrmB [Deltaproteobacteria bacterium]|nr:tRNA (guanosine(46)-N7)-methyltransferase TrmB [Deltaproteobacteria bacterium]
MSMHAVVFPRLGGRSFWTALFGDDAPVEIEIGCGDGTFLLTRAAAAPRHNLLGIERAPRKARRVAARVARLGTPRVRTLQADATYVLAIVPTASVHAYHVYFPDPWPKRRHGWRRIFSPGFIRALARTLVAGGEIYIATDVGTYMATIRAAIIASGTFVDLVPGDDHPGFGTAFAHKYRVEGRILHLARFARRARAEHALAGTPQPRPGSAASKIRSS